MNSLSSIIVVLAPCLCDYASKHAVYFTDLEENLEFLRNAMIELRDLSENLKRKV